MKSRRGIGWILATALMLLFGAWWIGVKATREQRTLARLVDAKAVIETDQIKLLYSTGVLRENKYIFECPETCVLDEAHGGITFDDLNPADPTDQALVNQVRRLMDSCLDPDIDWRTANVKVGDGKGLLTEVFVVTTSTKSYLVLWVF